MEGAVFRRFSGRIEFGYGSMSANGLKPLFFLNSDTEPHTEKHTEVFFMSYAVVHMKKVKGHGLKGVQFHHQRERESETNPDINKERTDLNYDLVNDSNIDFNKRVNEVIKNNVVTDRAIRKDAVRLCDFVITSDKEFFKRMNPRKQKYFFKKSVEFFEEKYGSQNVVYGKVHLDEHTPHIHIGLVPINKDGKLTAKTLFNKQGLRELQDQFPEYMKKHGYILERGEPKEHKKHIETVQYKKEKLINMSQSLSKTEEHIKHIINQLEGVEAKRRRFSSDLSISHEDYSILITLAKQGESKLLENTQLKAKVNALEEKNSNLNEKNNKFFDENCALRKRNQNLNEEITELTNSFRLAKKAIQNLKLVNEFNKEIRNIVNRERQNRQKNNDYEMEL